MATDPAALLALSKSLYERAQDLKYIGRQLSRSADSAKWTCAKAERYRAAMRAREAEFVRVAEQMLDLSLALKAQATAAAANPTA